MIQSEGNIMVETEKISLLEKSEMVWWIKQEQNLSYQQLLPI